MKRGKLGCNPEVTVGLPVSQEPLEYVRKAIESVFSQSMHNWELIIVCDGANSPTLNWLQKIREPRVRLVVEHERKGLAHRLNQLATLAGGTFLARMDADDVMFPERLEKQVSSMESDPSVDVLTSRAVVISPSDKVLGITRMPQPPYDTQHLMSSTPFVHPTAIARTKWWIDNPYDSSYDRSQDKALWLSTCVSSRFRILDQPLLFYRVAESLDPPKYARTAGYERRAMRQFGPSSIGNVGTNIAVLRSFMKQYLVAGASSVGLGPAVLQRRFQDVSDASRASWEEILSATPTESAKRIATSHEGGFDER